jgi:hypothetical protein
LNKIREKFICLLFEFKFVQVDGAFIRKEIDSDFKFGGNPARYRYIPKNEIWIEFNYKSLNFLKTAFHEYIEYFLMKNYKLNYLQAHELTEFFEKINEDFSNEDEFSANVLHKNLEEHINKIKQKPIKYWKDFIKNRK